MRVLGVILAGIVLAGCAGDLSPAQRQAMANIGAAVAQGGAPGIAPPQPAAPLPSILPPPPVRCTSTRDYMGQIHTICQ